MGRRGLLLLAAVTGGLLPLALVGIFLIRRAGAVDGGRNGSDTPVVLLAAAARAGDRAAIHALLSAGAEANAPAGGNGWTPLLHAVHTRSWTGARALLEGGVDPNAAGTAGQRPLLMAAAYGDAEMVSLLLDAGADPHLGGQGWRNALEAALTGSLDLDGLTFSRCQPAAVRVLVERSPDLVAGGPAGRLGRFFVYARGCDEIERLIETPPRPRPLSSPAAAPRGAGPGSPAAP